jgi:hypothetical protein
MKTLTTKVTAFKHKLLNGEMTLGEAFCFFLTVIAVVSILLYTIDPNVFK